MALINCPECGKEISDRAGSCPHCGCPVNNTSTESNTESQKLPINNTINFDIKKKLPIIMGIVVVIVIGIIIYNVAVVKPRKIEEQKKVTYEEAVELLEEGEYEEGKELLETIVGYDDVDIILEQIKWETKAYQCINEWKQLLKNPDSFVLHELYFYKEELEDPDSTDEVICIMRAGGQNGFGGNTSSYVLFSSENTVDAYCDSLDEEEIDEDDDDAFIQLLGCTIINNYVENGKEVGEVDMSRLKTVLKNDAYSTIKLIE